MSNVSCIETKAISLEDFQWQWQLKWVTDVTRKENSIMNQDVKPSH